MAMSLGQSRVCIGCLRTDRKIVDTTLYEAIFKDLTGTVISSSDGLPQWLCYECSALLQTCAEFRHKLMQSHNILSPNVLEGLPLEQQIEDTYAEDANMPVISEIYSIAEVREEDSLNDKEHKITQHQNTTKEESCGENTKMDILSIASISDQVDSDINEIRLVPVKHEKQTEQDERQEQIKVEREEVIIENVYEDDITKEACRLEDDLNEVKINPSMLEPKRENQTELDERQEQIKVEVKIEDVDDDDITIEECRLEDDLNEVTINPSMLESKREKQTEQGQALHQDAPVRPKTGRRSLRERLCFEDSTYLEEEPALASQTRDPEYITATKSSEDNRVNVKDNIDSDGKSQGSRNKKHKGDKPFICDVCMKSFKYKCDIDRHYLKHTGERPHKCDVCMKTFITNCNLKVHYRLHTGDKPYKCDVCMKRFIQMCHLKRHYNSHNDDKPYKCDVCMKSFIDNSTLKIHKRIHTGERPHKCDVCMKCFKTKSNLNVHYRKHTGKNLHKCDVCTKSFTHKHSLVVHNNIHTSEKPYKCDICMQFFMQKGHLYTHQLVHTDEYSYKCDVCMKYYVNKNSLIVHYRKHTGEKPHKCEYCMKRFNQKDQLNTHVRIHTGEKPYKCDVCKKGFCQKGQRDNHYRTHSGEKPYKCDVCMKCFTVKSGLKIHYRTHTGEKPYKCELCNKRFAVTCGLKAHIARAHNTKIYKCDICKKCYKDRGTFKKHMRTHLTKHSLIKHTSDVSGKLDVYI